MVDLEQAYPTDRIKLYPCDVCGRNFNQDSFGKHKSVCKQTTKKQRKIFDSGKQRSEGSDVQYQKTKETKKIQILGETPVQNKPNNWREQHKEFIRSIKNARVVTEAIKTGAPLPKFEPAAVPSDYVNCQYCMRNFSRNAAERHIPFCETQHKRQKMNSGNQAKASLPKSKAPVPSQQRKQSSEQYGYNENSNTSFSATNQRTPGHANNANNKGYSSGGAGPSIERKPIKYDNHQYYDSDSQDGGGYSQKSNGGYSQKAQKVNKQQELLRTGRNTLNSELNSLARNRTGPQGYSQKESPSRDPSQNRRPAAGGSQQNGTKASNPRGQPPQQHGQNSGSKFCHECGYEFPVQWARFCSYCGDQRLG